MLLRHLLFCYIQTDIFPGLIELWDRSSNLAEYETTAEPGLECTQDMLPPKKRTCYS